MNAYKVWMIISVICVLRTVISICTTGLGTEADLHLTGAVAAFALARTFRLEADE